MIIERIIEWGNTNPKRLFIIDGIGAILSAILLGVVLVKLEYLFGIPKPTLYFLASLPFIFAVYDFYCYHNIYSTLELSLKGIAFINLIYCCISIGLAIYHRKSITNIGWIYILIEVFLSMYTFIYRNKSC